MFTYSHIIRYLINSQIILRHFQQPQLQTLYILKESKNADFILFLSVLTLLIIPSASDDRTLPRHILLNTLQQ